MGIPDLVPGLPGGVPLFGIPDALVGIPDETFLGLPDGGSSSPRTLLEARGLPLVGMPDGLSSLELLPDALLELPVDDVLSFLGIPLGTMVGLPDGDFRGIPDEVFLTGIPEEVVGASSDGLLLLSLLGALPGEFLVGIPDFCMFSAMAPDSNSSSVSDLSKSSVKSSKFSNEFRFGIEFLVQFV